ncbi:MAG: hypothetical protein K0U54_02145 [Bacteroidetes bacterium]|nr:hypothetical protein [Bacteroidota bacterium]
MKLNLSNVGKLLPLVASLLFCYAYITKFGYLFILYLILHGSWLLYHLLFENGRSTLVIKVFAFLIISSSFGVYFTFFPFEPNGAYYYLLGTQLPWLIAFFLIFVRMVEDNPFKLKLNIWSPFILLVIGLNWFFAEKFLGMIDEYSLSSEHILYSFSYTILKMLMMSIGLIFFITNTGKYQKTSFLNGAFLCFFIGDIASTFNSLVYFNNPITALSILEAGFYCIALWLFYIYCVSPGNLRVTEKR